MKPRVYTFVDNSNIFIEAQKEYGLQKNSQSLGKRYRLDFGRLFAHIANNRGDIFFSTRGRNSISYPKLYGSEPPQNDSLWRFLDGMGVDVNVFKRNAFNKEKKVDTKLVWDVAELIGRTRYSKENKNHVIAIAGGDADFYDLYDSCMKVGYTVEYYCWEHSAANEIKRLPTFHNLTSYIDKLGFVEKDRFAHDFGEINWSEVVSYD